MIVLRDTQEKFASKAVEVLTSKSTKKCVMVAPVAYGKSICIANIVSRLDAPTVVLQPNKELLEQNYIKYTYYGYDASICCQSLKIKQKNKLPYTIIQGEELPCREVGDTTYATIGSIKSLIDLVKERGVKYMIIDECHMNTGTSSDIRSFIEGTKIKNILGVTATPVVLHNTMEGAKLKIIDSAAKNMFSTISYVVQVQEMIENRYWADLVYEVHKIEDVNYSFNSSGSDYDAKTIEEIYVHNNLHNRCIKRVEKLRKDGKKSILIFAPDVEKAIRLSKEIKGSAVVHGEMPIKERKEVLEKFKSLEIDVVINVEILTTGFDHPELDTIIMLRPTASIALYYQIMGRITRKHPTKLFGFIVDFSGNVHKFGKIENLNYEYIEGYGWGLFSKDILLTGHPIKSRTRPTKATLRKAATDAGYKEVRDHGNVKIWFKKSKYKDKRLCDVPESYLTFMLDNFDFNGTRMKSLKNSIEIYLKLK